MDPFLGQITMFGGNFAPYGWASCNGQLLSIKTHSSLFSLLGTTYGGDGRSTFALPDMRGRVPVHYGQGPGLSNYTLGRRAGVERVTLNILQIPQHNHYISSDTAVSVQVGVNSEESDTTNPTNAILGLNGTAAFNEEDPTAILGGVTSSISGFTQYAGDNQSHPNLQPLLAVNFIIAMEGVYPSRN